jgi:hypothetical protein
MSSLIFLLFSIGLYFAPTFIAYNQERRNALSIFILNLFLGWTFLGWVGALIWAVANDK